MLVIKIVYLLQVKKGRTTIIVAHRLSTIRNADKIILLSKGQVVEEGDHNSLMSLKGHYYSLVTAQVHAKKKRNNYLKKYLKKELIFNFLNETGIRS